MCHLLQRIAANRNEREARRHGYQHHYNPQQYNANCQSVPRVEVQAEVMRASQPPQLPPQRQPQPAPQNPQTPESPQAPHSPTPFLPGIVRQSGATHTTTEGLTLSRGPNGELHATIANKENSIGINYSRKNGAYSTDTSLTKIYENGPTNSTLQSITQEGTYALKVEHHGGGQTTLAIDMDPSLLEMRVQTGDKLYRLRESDIRALDQKVATAAIAAKPPQIKGQSAPPAPGTSIVPALVGKTITSVKASQPVIREALTKAFEAVETAAKQAEVVKLAEARAKAAGLEVKPKETLKLTGPSENKASSSRELAPAPKEPTRVPTNTDPSPSDKRLAAKNVESTSAEIAKKAESPQLGERKALPSQKSPSTTEPTAAKSESTTASTTKQVSSESKAQVEAKQADTSKHSESPKTDTTKADSTKAAESVKPTEGSTSSPTSEPHYDPVKRALGRFEKMVDSYRYMVNDGEGASNQAKAGRNLAERYGKEAGMSPDQIKAALDGNPPSSAKSASSPKAGGNGSETASKASPQKGASSPATSTTANGTALTSQLTPSSTALAPVPKPPTMTAPVDMNARLAESLKRFNENAKMSEWAKNNQFKAMTYAASLSEAVTGAMKANYGPNDPHSPVPRLIGLLNTDIEKGFEFTTQQGGLTASIAAEATRSASDTALAFGVFAGADAGVMAAASTRAGQALGGRAAASVAGRALGFAGVAYHGYSTFSDGSFAQQNDLQLAGSTASPVVMGAVMGAPLGPVGAGGGAILGAGSEIVGVAVGYARLQGQIDDDWKKREVRESLRLAEQGFVLPDNSPMLNVRKPFESLPSEHQEVLTDVARMATLARLTKEVVAKDLTALGFKTEPSTSATPEERNAIGTHNWERMIQLTEGRAGYNPYRLWAGDYLDEVKRSSPYLAKRFEETYRDAKQHYVSVYNRAPHVTYALTASKVTEQSELLLHLNDVVKSIPVETSASETLKRLKEGLPGIEVIMQQHNSRMMLINNLEGFSGNTGKYRKLLELSELQ